MAVSDEYRESDYSIVSEIGIDFRKSTMRGFKM